MCHSKRPGSWDRQGQCLVSISTRLKLDLARRAAEESELTNVRFLHGNASEVVETATFDYAYARCLLTHLSDPVVVEDIDVSGAFCDPANPHFRRLTEAL